MPEALRFGKYVLFERVATGGMAEVFRAQATGSERLLALKRIHPHHLENADFVSMLIDEAKISCQLAHPNIIQVVDLGRVDRHYFIAMEYVDGRDLRRVIERMADAQRVFPTKHACAILAGVARGLHYAHEKQDARGAKMEIIHRDISPQNVLVGFDGQVKVIDFGIAKAANRLMETQVGILKGKYAYMSPEQATGGALDHRTDLFSAGIMLYECCVGRHPFRAPHDLETLRNIKNSSLVAPREVYPQLPPDVERIILKALAPRREDRYADAGAMADDLDAAVERLHPGYGQADLADFVGELFSDEVTTEGDARPSAESTAGVSRRADRLRSGTTVPANRIASTTVPISGPDGAPTDPGPARVGSTTLNVQRAAEDAFAGFVERMKTGRLTGRDNVFLGLFSATVILLAVSILFWPESAPVAPGGAASVPSPAPVRANEMVIDSSPQGADVRVRGQLLKGKTPIAIQGVPAGQRLEVTVSKTGFVPETRVVGGGERVVFSLRPVAAP